jgi:hypothetical protein
VALIISIDITILVIIMGPGIKEFIPQNSFSAIGFHLYCTGTRIGKGYELQESKGEVPKEAAEGRFGIVHELISNAMTIAPPHTTPHLM